MIRTLLASAAALGFFATAALATPATEISPTGGALPAGVTRVGGIVVDLRGTNGTRVVSQLAASTLYRGFSDLNENPQPGNAAGKTTCLIVSDLVAPSPYAASRVRH